MQDQDYISEQDACTRAGVSINTLRRFAEAGYFNTKADEKGQTLYPFKHLAELLSLEIVEEPSSKTAPHVEPIPAAEELPAFAAAKPTAPSDVVTEKVIEITLSAPKNQENEKEENKEPVPAQTNIFTTKASSGSNFSTALPEYSPEIKPERASSPDFSQRLFARQLESKIQEAERELVRYKNVSSMQEKLLDIREKEIEDLRSQRDWLKTRVQSLEDQSNRFQVLMLNEMQMTSKLIRLQVEKKSGVARALQWLGIGNNQDEHNDENPSKTRTIVSE